MKLSDEPSVYCMVHWKENMRYTYLAACCAIVIASGAATMARAGDDGRTPVHPPLVPIASLDVPRYMGRWYEIAKYPNRFQKKCASDTRAEYSLLADGRVKVLNRCRTASGEPDIAEGVARQVGGKESARLEVRFAPAWLSFLPAVWGDYWVIDLDADYRLVAVSEPKREYLWILAHTPEVDQVAYASLLKRLKGRGFDPERLETTLHINGE
jgi:apolipoprotein D and lipocalin family protein